MNKEQSVVETERAIITRNLERHHIETVWGKASLPNPHTVRVTLKRWRDARPIGGDHPDCHRFFPVPSCRGALRQSARA